MPIQTEPMPVAEFKEYLTEMLRRADGTVSTEMLVAWTWQKFLPYVLYTYTVAGVLERVAQEIAEPELDGSEDDDDDEEGE